MATNYKSKETKGKRKGLPKLKTILANPNKNKCPTLDEDELQHLGQLLRNAISMSGLKPQQFATSNHIRLGLESSLRTINNSKCSCVLLSLTIQPRFLVRIIARNVEAKDASAPVYVQTQLEEFTKDIFGVRALALVLPSVEEMRLTNLNEKLINWVELRMKRVKPKLERLIPKFEKIIQKEVKKTENDQTASESQQIETENMNKKLDGDFISFSNVIEVEKADSEEDAHQLAAVLRKVAEQAEKRTTSQQMLRNKAKIMKHTHNKFGEGTASDCDDFLPEIYQPLTVHKIQPNPNKKPKKKRQKMKKK